MKTQLKVKTQIRIRQFENKILKLPPFTNYDAFITVKDDNKTIPN